MIPGIYYLYEYKNEQRLRNAGFCKISQHYHTCILKINARRIPIPSDGVLKLFVFYGEDSNSVSREIAEIPCEDENVSTTLSVSDSMFPGSKTLEAMDGFFLRTGDGQFYGAVSNEACFDARKIRNWEEPERINIETEIELPPETEAQPAAETEVQADAKAKGQHVDKTDEELDTGNGAPPGTGPGNPPRMGNGVPPGTGPGTFPRMDNVIPPATGTGEPQNMNTGEQPVPEAEEPALIDIGVPPVTETEPQPSISAEELPNAREKCITGVSYRTGPQQNSALGAASQANTDFTEKAQTKSSENVRKIQRSELCVLPRRYWNIANNSFLMHGYHNYHHLMLVESDGHYWIGVPGIYTPREARAAELFGFPQFTKSHVEHLDLASDERDENCNFGHWCRYMM